MTEPSRLVAESWTRKRRPSGRKEIANPAMHGTRNGYVYGCGCDPCTEAERLYSRAYKRRRAQAQKGDTG